MMFCALSPFYKIGAILLPLEFKLLIYSSVVHIPDVGGRLPSLFWYIFLDPLGFAKAVE